MKYDNFLLHRLGAHYTPAARFYNSFASIFTRLLGAQILPPRLALFRNTAGFLIPLYKIKARLCAAGSRQTESRTA